MNSSYYEEAEPEPTWLYEKRLLSKLERGWNARFTSQYQAPVYPKGRRLTDDNLREGVGRKGFPVIVDTATLREAMADAKQRRRVGGSSSRRGKRRVSNSARGSRKGATGSSSSNAFMSGFASVAAAFDFHHHVGSDPSKELEVLKCILMREGYIARLRDIADRIRAGHIGDLRDENAAKTLELLSHTREATLNTIETIADWRISSESEQLMAFMWHGENYLLKICSDIDFLSTAPALVNTLQVTASKLRRNPLMRKNTLDELAEDPNAVDMSMARTLCQPLQPQPDDTAETMREKQLMRAEKLLLMEPYLHSLDGSTQTSEVSEGPNATAAAALSMTSTEAASTETGAPSSSMARPRPAAGPDVSLEGVNAASTVWVNKAQEQLARLRNNMNEDLSDQCTHRLDLARESDDQVFVSPLDQLYEPEIASPTRLTALLSTSPRRNPTAAIHELSDYQRVRSAQHFSASTSLSRPQPEDSEGEEASASGAPEGSRARMLRRMRLRGLNRPAGEAPAPTAAEPGDGDGGDSGKPVYRQGVVTSSGDPLGRRPSKTSSRRSGSRRARSRAGRRRAPPPVPQFTVADLTGPMTIAEAEDLLRIENPPRLLEVCGAAALILLTPGRVVPTKVKWDAFVEVVAQSLLDAEDATAAAAVGTGSSPREESEEKDAKATEENEYVRLGQAFHHELNGFDVQSVPKFKARALIPFLPNQKADVDPEQFGSGAYKLVHWVRNIVDAMAESMQEAGEGGAEQHA